MAVDGGACFFTRISRMVTEWQQMRVAAKPIQTPLRPISEEPESSNRFSEITETPEKEKPVAHGTVDASLTDGVPPLAEAENLTSTEEEEEIKKLKATIKGILDNSKGKVNEKQKIAYAELSKRHLVPAEEEVERLQRRNEQLEQIVISISAFAMEAGDPRKQPKSSIALPEGGNIPLWLRHALDHSIPREKLGSHSSTELGKRKREISPPTTPRRSTRVAASQPRKPRQSGSSSRRRSPRKASKPRAKIVEAEDDDENESEDELEEEDEEEDEDEAEVEEDEEGDINAGEEKEFQDDQDKDAEGSVEDNDEDADGASTEGKPVDGDFETHRRKKMARINDEFTGDRTVDSAMRRTEAGNGLDGSGQFTDKQPGRAMPNIRKSALKMEVAVAKLPPHKLKAYVGLNGNSLHLYVIEV